MYVCLVNTIILLLILYFIALIGVFNIILIKHVEHSDLIKALLKFCITNQRFIIFTIILFYKNNFIRTLGSFSLKI